MGKNKRLRLIRKAAHLYYNEGIKQNRIATLLGMPPVQVGRILKEAREREIVQFRIERPPLSELEQKVEDRYRTSGLEDVYLTTSAKNYEGQRARIGKVAARYFDESVAQGSSIAVSDGYYIYSMVQALSKKLREVDIYPLEFIGRNLEFMQVSATLIVSYLWHKCDQGGKAFAFSLPPFSGPFTKARQVAKLMFEQKYFMDTFDAARNADIIFTNVGHYRPDCLRAQMLSKLDIRLDDQANDAIVGFLGWTAFDKNAHPLLSKKQREALLTVPPEDYRAAARDPERKVVLVTSERTAHDDVSRLDGIRVLLENGFVNVLITDEMTGEKLIE